MTEPLEEAYFSWLCLKVLPATSNVYRHLLKILFMTEFTWVIPEDRNRAEDGKELREYFCQETGAVVTKLWMEEPCSVLEMMIGLAARADFQTHDSLGDWFWRFISNLELDELRHISRGQESVVHDVLFNFCWRLYDNNGHGGIFPLRWPQLDQRQVELWYQFNEYVEEQRLT